MGCCRSFNWVLKIYYMKWFVVILFLLVYQFSYSQQLLINGNTYTNGTQRILIDLGGNGTGDISLTDVGHMTPDNSSRIGQDVNGRWWNNITNGEPSVTLLANAVDVNGGLVSGLNISLDKWPRGTFSTTDSSMNFSGWTTAAVGDYPVTATEDNLYFHSTAGVVTMTITIPAGKTASIKFWGSRVTTGTIR